MEYMESWLGYTIVNGDRQLLRYIEDLIVPVHSEEALCIIKSLDPHEMIPRDQHSAPEVKHEDTSALQYWNLPFIIDNFIVKD